MGIHLKLKYRSTLSMVYMVIFGILLFDVVYSFRADKKFQTAIGKNEEARQDFTAGHTNGFWQAQLPICEGNLLDRTELHYDIETNGFFHNSRLISETRPCRLRQYTVEDVVTCLDGNQDRFAQRGTKPITVRHRQELRFVFIGDSRIRQQFLNFIKLIPEYDRKSQPYPIPYKHQGDIEATSNILNVRVSYKWQPLLNNTLVKTVRRWITDPSERPYWILISMTVWHMLKQHGATTTFIKAN